MGVHRTWIWAKLRFSINDRLILLDCGEGEPMDSAMGAALEYLLEKGDPAFRLAIITDHPEGFQELDRRGRVTVVGRNTALSFKYLAAARFLISTKPFPKWMKTKQEQQVMLTGSCDGGISPEEIGRHIQAMSQAPSRGFSFYGLFRAIGADYVLRRIEGSFLYRGLFLRREDSRRLYGLKGIHQGEKAFLIGNGPSLRAGDLDQIEGRLSFACNSIHHIYGQTRWRPSYHFIVDTLYYRDPEYREGLLRHLDCPCIMPHYLYKRLKKAIPDACSVHTRTGRQRYRARPNLLSFRNESHTVMIFMLEMAIFMGVREICLLGVDNSLSFKDGDHFYNDQGVHDRLDHWGRRMTEEKMRRRGVDSQDPQSYLEGQLADEYAAVKRYAERKGVRIVNCGRGGRLEIFQRATLEEMLS